MGSVGGKKSGGSIYKSTNETYLQQFENAGTKILTNELSGMNMTLVEKTLSGVADTLKEFGLDMSVVTAIGHGWQKNETAGVNGFNQLHFGDSYKTNENEFKMTKQGWVIDHTAYGTGTHEAGHLISNFILEKVYNAEGKTQLQKSQDRHSGKWDLRLAKEAKNELGKKLSPISEYGGSLKGQKSSEFIAEAVSDYMKNKNKANKSSLAVVKVLKKYLK